MKSGPADRSYRVGSVMVTDPPVERSLHEEFETLHVNDELAAERSTVATMTTDRAPPQQPGELGAVGPFRSR